MPYLPGVGGTFGQETVTEYLRQSFRQVLKKGWTCEGRGGSGKRGSEREVETHPFTGLEAIY